MSKLKDLAIDERNDSIEIAYQIELLSGMVTNHLDKYTPLQVSNNVSFPKLKKTPGRCLNVSTGVVSFIEVNPKELVVHFR